MPADIFNLQRFVEAQNPLYSDIIGELRAGQKRTHWMWFVFPQISGLGRSEIARFYSLQSLDEAKAYLEHSVLAARLKECTDLVIQIQGRTANQIFGSPDDMKFCSCITLFENCAGLNSIFTVAIDKYFAGERDKSTWAILKGNNDTP